MNEELVRNACIDCRTRFVRRGRRADKKQRNLIRRCLQLGANVPHFAAAGFTEHEIRKHIFPVYRDMPEEFHRARAKAVALKRKRQESENERDDGPKG